VRLLSQPLSANTVDWIRERKHRLKEWQSRKTDLEVRIEAEKERRKAVKQMNASW